jgi:hypothetical protein
MAQDPRLRPVRRTTDPRLRSRFNETEFQDWYKNWASKLDLDPNPDDPRQQYDYRAAFRAGAEPTEESGWHWPSEFKQEGHPNLIVEGRDTRTGERSDPRLRAISKEPERDKGFLGSLLEPTTDLPSRFARSVSKYIDPQRSVTGPRAYTSAFIESLGDVVSGLTSPLDLALTATTGGASLARKAGLESIAKAAAYGTKGLSAPIAAEGVYRMGTAESPMEAGVGLVETVGGAFGMRTPVTRATRSTPPRVAAEAAETVEKQLIDNPVTKLKNAIDEAYPLRKKQESIYTAERGERVAKAKEVTTTGEAGFYEELGKLKGEHTRVETIPLRQKLEQPDVDSLFMAIKNAPIGDYFVKVHGRTGLAKILKGEIPQESELKVLSKVFGRDFVEGISNRMTQVDRRQNLISEVVNFPRSLMASMDFSAPLRQGLPLIHKKAFYTSFDDMFKSWWSEDAFRGVQESIEANPRYGLALESKLQLTDLTSLRNREEQFMSTFAEKIPGVRRSNRAYVGFLNKLRMDTFNSLLDDASKMGLDPEKNLLLTRNIAQFVNNSTGRGSLGRLERHAPLLNSMLFSPRLIASRVQMLNPQYYYKLDPFARKEALKALFAAASAGSTLASLSAMSGMGEVDTNPTSSDFGKIRIGDTRIDPYGGFQQYIVAANKLITGKSTSTLSGRETDLTAGQFGRPTRLDILQRFGESKLHPVVSFAVDLLRGRDFSGKPTEIPEAIARRVFPILIQDVFELATEEPDLLPLAIPAAFGMGIQTYGPER